MPDQKHFDFLNEQEIIDIAEKAAKKALREWSNTIIGQRNSQRIIDKNTLFKCFEHITRQYLDSRLNFSPDLPIRLKTRSLVVPYFPLRCPYCGRCKPRICFTNTHKEYIERAHKCQACKHTFHSLEHLEPARQAKIGKREKKYYQSIKSKKQK